MLNKKARINIICWVIITIIIAYFMNLGGTKDMMDNYMFGINNTSTNLFAISNTTPETENLIDTQIIQEDTNIEETFIDQYGFFIIILLIILLIIIYLMYRYFSTNKSKQKPKKCQIKKL